MKLVVRSQVFEVKDFAEASATYCRLRNESGEGGSTFRPGRLAGNYISYNGRVWKGKPRDWTPGTQPVYSPA